MASEIDFLDMYRTLGLRPGCALPVFKQAYRRQVARLHPDRGGDGAVDPAAAERLRRLIAQYDAAMAFQREHGRLPGAMPQVRFSVPEARVQVVPAAPARHRGRLRAGWMLLCLVVAGALAWLFLGQSPARVEEPAPALPAARPLGAATASGPVLDLGMSREDVRAIEGEPLGIHGDRWDYGPSWVRFEGDRVVDWYSSPLHSLGPIPTTPGGTLPIAD